MSGLRISICVPTYNGSRWIRPTLRTILTQSFRDFEVVICDDNSTDDTCGVVEAIGDPRIRVVRNSRNIGYGGNLQRCMEHARNDIVVLMGQDDLVCDGYLQKIHDIFVKHPEVGVVTRAYFWFQGDVKVPVRAKPPVEATCDSILSINTAPPELLFRAISSMDQLSCLALRREWIQAPVHSHVFPAHVYPVMSVWKRHALYCMKDNVLAVRIESSQSRSVKSIYDPSPVWTWVQLFETMFPEPEFTVMRTKCIRDFVATNYVGLVQIRNYGRYSWLLREIGMLLRYRWVNVFSPQFWFFSLGCMVMPPLLLIGMVDGFKRRFLSRSIDPIDFRYTAE
ncbi:MAG: glycosyltransferase family A protein [bacterium]